MSAALQTMVNGKRVNAAKPAVFVEDRGLQYGDGVFETMLLRDGQVRFLSDHLARLHSACARLGIAAPDEGILRRDLEELCSGHTHGIVKLIVTRGGGGRGYRAPAEVPASRILSLYPPITQDIVAMTACWCTTRLGRNAALAGMKHLNRLEQVLAQSEFSAPEFAEGLMLDTEGEVVCGTSSNVFIAIDGALVTPDLRFSGVQGVMRKNVITAAMRLGIAVEERAVWPTELSSASEVFVTNTIRGIRSVRRLEEHQWETTPIARTLTEELHLS